MNSFEKFKKRGAPRSSEPTISIRTNGALGINAAAVREYFGECRYVEFYFDRDNKVMGIKPVQEKTEDSYSLFLSKRSRSATVSARKFLSHYGIDYGQTRRLPLQWDEENQLLTADLKEKKT